MNSYNFKDVAVYGGYLKDEGKLLQSASGGAATALSEQILADGGFVAGVTFSDDFYSAEYILTDDINSLGKLKGSKYVEVNTDNIFSEVSELLKQDKRILFFGLPCIVAALYKYLGERPDNLITCELVCYGCVDKEIHRQYIDYLEKKFSSKITYFSTKHKEGKWSPTYLYAEFENGKIFKKPFYGTEYGFAFASYGRKNCYQCKFKGDNRTADLMIGDFWGAKESEEYWNEKGVSIIFAETEKGNELIKSNGFLKLWKVDFKTAIAENLMVVKPRAKNQYYEKFECLLKEKGLIYAANHCVGMSIRIKKKLKSLISSVAGKLSGAKG